MTGMDELVTWLRAQLDEDERVAREASRSLFGDGWTPAGEHWRWETGYDQVITLDPMLDGYLNEGADAYLRSAEEYPNSTGPLSHTVARASEIRTVDAMHIARWDPARVLAEVDVKRRIIEWCVAAADRMDAPAPLVGMNVLAAMAQPYADRPGYQEEWRPS